MPAGESAYFENPEFSYRLWEDYVATAPLASKVGIKRPDILCRTDLRARVANTHPNIKLIVVLREPISRAVSAYFHLVRMALLPVKPLETGMRICLDSYYSGAEDIRTSVIEFGRYGAHLQEWLKYYPRESLYITEQTQVNSQLPSVLSEICSMIGVNCPIPQVLNDTNRKNLGMYNLTRLRMSRYAQRLKTVELPDSSRRVPRTSTVLRGLGYGLTFAANKLDTLEREKPRLSNSLQSELREIYRKDLNDVTASLGRPPSWAAVL
jgi:hypothetical protein